jgi:ElaB/YqjD/DUF883 family membrane-anchored ribosome-binding protein
MANTTTSPLTGNQIRGAQTGASGGHTVSEFLDKSRDAAVAATNKVEEKVEGVMQTVKDAASSVADTAQRAYDATAETLSGFNDDVMKLINRHPKQAVCIGFGLGFLVGALVCGGAFAANRR